MKSLRKFSLEKYSIVLSDKVPIPGGGSAGAYTGALGAALLAMVANYSLGKSSNKIVEKKIQKILKESQASRQQFLKFVDEDAKVYLEIVKARKKSPQAKKQAMKEAKDFSVRMADLAYQTIQLAPDLVKYGNQYLMSDVEIACDCLVTAYQAALVNWEANQ
jgi:formiminotetrahydrofolate cyclodeaminase